MPAILCESASKSAVREKRGREEGSSWRHSSKSVSQPTNSPEEDRTSFGIIASKASGQEGYSYLLPPPNGIRRLTPMEGLNFHALVVIGVVALPAD